MYDFVVLRYGREIFSVRQEQEKGKEKEEFVVKGKLQK